jgi:RNA polymerase sigma-70 factor, ECF subfamily
MLPLTLAQARKYRQPPMPAILDSSDGDLARTVAALQPGSAEAAEGELYRRFAPRVRLYGLRHMRDEDAARDLVQQVLLLTIQKLRGGLVRDVDDIASFILGTSRMMVKDLKRLEWRREKLRNAFLPSSIVEAPAADAVLDLDRLESCLAGLADRERSVVLLTFYAEKTATEVGKALRTTAGNVRVIRHRAIERLRRCVESREEGH